MYSQFSSPLPVNGLLGVKGENGALAFPLGPNSSIPLFDFDEDVLYVKRTDPNGFVTLRTFDLLEREPKTEQAPVTREEFNELKEMIESLSAEDGEEDAE